MRSNLEQTRIYLDNMWLILTQQFQDPIHKHSLITNHEHKFNLVVKIKEINVKSGQQSIVVIAGKFLPFIWDFLLINKLINICDSI